MPTLSHRFPAIVARRARAVGLLTVALALCAARPGRAEPLPLPAADQARVNQAIERGVKFLKKSQGPQGSWAGARNGHFLGYAALPGLTLLECGVPADDPVIRRAAAFVRRAAPRNDATYEIALSILFLDRLGDPEDKPLIQALAVRLLAGQDVTGGWNYRCGAVGKKNQEEIVALLRQMNQPGKAPGLMGLPVVKPGDPPGLPGTPVRKPGALDGKPVRKPGALDGKPVKNPPALDGTPVGPKRKELPPSGPAVGAPASPGGTPTRKDKPAPDKAPTGSLKVTPPLPARVGPGPAVKPGGAAARPPEAGAVKAPEGGVVIPKNLRFLAAFRDRNPLLDGAGRFRPSTDPKARTDNSNTQFALLAIWVAQRHDVPMQRTLDLLARRYEKSQNADGSWDYLFYYGGCPADLVDRKFGSHRPQMTCVGLMGLALGHGLRPAGAGKVPPAPQIVNGFAALSAYIGQPTGAYLPGPQNLYFLWSVERVAMLYDLPTVGGKDWYRWGAEILVANQQPLGNWDKGGYIGTSRPLDTSLALLFLKRANLVKDLTARLPFDTKELDRTITLRVGSLPASPGAAPDLPARNKR